MKQWRKYWIASVIILLLISVGLWALPTTPCNGLGWSANTELDLAGYKVYWRTDPTVAYTNANSYDAKKVTNILFDTAIPAVGTSLRSTKHYFVVTAYDSQVVPNESGFSNEVSCKRPPSAPSGLGIQ